VARAGVVQHPDEVLSQPGLPADPTQWTEWVQQRRDRVGQLSGHLHSLLGAVRVKVRQWVEAEETYALVELST
jgi:hypothetical protein